MARPRSGTAPPPRASRGTRAATARATALRACDVPRRGASQRFAHAATCRGARLQAIPNCAIMHVAARTARAAPNQMGTRMNHAKQAKTILALLKEHAPTDRDRQLLDDVFQEAVAE